MRTSLIRRAAASLLALSLVSAAPLAVQAQEDETQKPISLTQEHVTLEHTEYEYTGNPIEPNVTVRVEGTLLTLDQHYFLSFADNTEVGQAKATITGIETAGYTGKVEIPFTIVPKATEPSQPSEPSEPSQPSEPPKPLAITEDSVKLEKTEFVYAGKAVEPKVTVTVEGKVLTAGTDYKLAYENNSKPGTAYAVITAADGSSYTGSVRVKFTITEAEKSPAYTVTAGADGKWYQKSGKTLSFTASGEFSKFVGVSVDGKRLADSAYTAKSGSTVVTLKNSYLNTLKQGKHTLTVHFEDGKAETAFQVLAAKDGTNPATGDTVHLWAGILFVSLTGLAGAGFAWARKLRR